MNQKLPKKRNAKHFEEHEEVIRCIDLLVSYFEKYRKLFRPEIEPFDFNQMLGWLNNGREFAEDRTIYRIL